MSSNFSVLRSCKMPCATIFLRVLPAVLAAIEVSAASAQSTDGDANAQGVNLVSLSELSSTMRWELSDLNPDASGQPDQLARTGASQPTVENGGGQTSTEKMESGLVPEGREFTFIVAPYVWIPTVTGDIGLGAQGIPLNLNAGDLLDVFEFGGLIRGEFRHKSGWGVSVDHIFADLGTGFDILIGDVDVSIDAGITEVAIIRRIESGTDSFEPYAGIRHWNAHVTAEIQSFFFNGTVEVGDKWTDPIVGLRYIHPMGQRWRLIAQGDIGGFGAGSNFSWNAAAGASYALSRRSQFQVVYRVLSVDRESPAIGGGSPVDLDLSISGPLIGFAYQF